MWGKLVRRLTGRDPNERDLAEFETTTRSSEAYTAFGIDQRYGSSLSLLLAGAIRNVLSFLFAA